MPRVRLRIEVEFPDRDSAGLFLSSIIPELEDMRPELQGESVVFELSDLRPSRARALAASILRMIQLFDQMEKRIPKR